MDVEPNDEWSQNCRFRGLYMKVCINVDLIKSDIYWKEKIDLLGLTEGATTSSSSDPEGPNVMSIFRMVIRVEDLEIETACLNKQITSPQYSKE